MSFSERFSTRAIAKNRSTCQIYAPLQPEIRYQINSAYFKIGPYKLGPLLTRLKQTRPIIVYNHLSLYKL